MNDETISYLLNKTNEFANKLKDEKFFETKTYRACEVCGKTDVETAVVSSTIGPMSSNYCSVCSAMGAEQPGLEEFVGEYVTYNSSKDSYMFRGTVREIVLKTGERFKTRKEYLDFQKIRIKSVESADWNTNVGTDKASKNKFVLDKSMQNCDLNSF